MNFIHLGIFIEYLCVPCSLLKAGDTMVSSEVFTSTDVQ